MWAFKIMKKCPVNSWDLMVTMVNGNNIIVFIVFMVTL